MRTKSTLQRFFGNFSSLVVGKVLGDVFTFAFFVLLSRTFGKEGIGQYSFAIALTGFFVVFSEFGLNTLSIKEMSRDNESLLEYFGNILCLRVLLATAVFVLMFAVLPFLGLSREMVVVIIIVGMYQVLYSLVDGVGSIFIARQDMHFVGLVEMSLKMTTAIAGIIAMKVGAGLILVLSVLPAVSFIHLFIVYLIVLKKYGRPVFRLSIVKMKVTLREAVPYGLSMFLIQLNSRLDVVFLGFLMGSTAAGIYNVGYRVVFMILFLPRFIGTTLFPIASKLFMESHSKLQEIYNKALRFSCLVGLPLASGLCLIAPELIRVVFGEEFMESSEILRYLSWLLFLIFIRVMMGNFLTACDRQTDKTKSQFFAACLNIVGNVILIPLLGIKGAAIATLLSESLLVFLFALRTKDTLGWPKIGSRLAIGSLATLSFVGPLFFYEVRALIVTIPVAVIVYAAVLIFFKETRNNEVQIIVRLLKGGFRKETQAG